MVAKTRTKTVRELYYRYLPPNIPLSAIRRFARRIAERFDPEKIILFGSFAYGTPHEDSDVDLLEQEFDREILEEAMVRVRLRVAPQTWEAFRLLALENLAGAQVAAQLHMKVATVFVARSKVQKMIREEISKLEHVS